MRCTRCAEEMIEDAPGFFVCPKCGANKFWDNEDLELDYYLDDSDWFSINYDPDLD